MLAPLRFAPHSYRPLSKVRCCRPKKFGRLPEGLPHQPSPRTNPSKNRTIPLAFRRMSVCVCLVGFASLQSPWAHTLRHPCLACSSRCTEYCHSHNNCKKTKTIIPQKSPSHLPPLSKGGGLTERHKPLYCCFLLVPRPPFFIHQTFLPSRRRDCYIPSLRTTFLPPLVKGEVLSPKKFGRLPEGLPHLPYPFRFSDTSVNNLSFHTQPSQNRTIPFAFRVASSTAPLPTKIKSAPVFTGANSSSH